MSSNDYRGTRIKMKQKAAMSVRPSLKVFSESAPRSAEIAQVSDDEKASENVFIFRFRAGRGVRIPLLDSNLERSRIDS